MAQSGSIGIALLNCAQGFGLSHLITSGNEAVTTAADYLDALIDDAAVTTVIAFLEQLRKPERFVEVARRAYSVMVELYRDVAIRLAPVTQSVALQMIGETRAAALLSGWRGRPRGDLVHTAAAVVALSRFIADFRDDVVEVEINPLGILEEGLGARALDCLIVRRA